MELLKTVDLVKYFNTPAGQVHAVDKINISLEKGKTIGVVGESGCGKSTLGRTILRLIEPTGGQVLYNGKDIASLSKKEMNVMRQKMQIIFQDPYASLNPRMCVFDLIAEPIRVNNLIKDKYKLEEKVFNLMSEVGLAERLSEAYPHELDGGRRQRIGVARALALDPEFIVCDEPVSALDVSIQAQILNMLMDLQDKIGLTYMFITHDLSVVKHIADDIMVMYMGNCVEKASSKELFKNPLHPYTRALLQAVPIPKLGATNIQKNVIRGEVSSPINPKPGCRFVARCQDATDKCRNNDLILKEISKNHFVACTMLD